MDMKDLNETVTEKDTEKHKNWKNTCLFSVE